VTRPDNPPAAAPPSPAKRVRPLKPRPRLFLVLCILFALWMAALLVFYFKVVYPARPPGHRMTTPNPVGGP